MVSEEVKELARKAHKNICPNADAYTFVRGYVNGYEDALQTTHTPKGVTKKELLELLMNYPDDAVVVVECCNVRKLSYNERDNTIRID